MPILSIISEPGSATQPNILPSYRPIQFRVKATATDGTTTPPVVFCDIYFNDVYYKTLSATLYDKLNTDSTEWIFDISSASQQYLRRDLPINGGSTIRTADRYVAKVFCRFRSSGIDANGFTTSEDVPPVQGTGSVPPQAGSGTESEDFLVCNATLQHDQNQDFLTHLRYAIANGNFDAQAYPLSHRGSKYRICKGDSDYFPFLYLGNQPFLKIGLYYKTKGSNSFTQVNYTIAQVCNSQVQNLQAVLKSNNDVLVSYDAAGVDPSTFYYKIDSGSYLSVPSNPFTITFRQFLMYLITEAGEQVILDQTGNIIIPQDVVVYDTPHVITLKPTCANGVDGTSAQVSVTIPSVAACDPPLLFQFSHIDGANIVFDVQLPAGKTDLQIEYYMDYGGGQIVTPFNNVSEFGLDVGQTQISWQVPLGTSNVTFVFNARTKCSGTSLSQWSPEVRVNYNLAFTQVTLTLVSITNLNDGNYYVDLQLSAPVADDLTVRGYFQADGMSGTLQTFGFVCVIAHGLTEAKSGSPGAPPNGNANLADAHIEVVSPNPTSDAKKIVF